MSPIDANDAATPSIPDRRGRSEPVAAASTASRQIHNQKTNSQLVRSATTRAARLRRLYGLSVEDFDAMLDEQDGLCVVCGGIGATEVDHDHSCCPTAKTCGDCVRGVLCRSCNTSLGKFDDDAAALLAQADLLEAEPPTYPDLLPFRGKPRTYRAASRYVTAFREATGIVYVRREDRYDAEVVV